MHDEEIPDIDGSRMDPEEVWRLAHTHSPVRSVVLAWTDPGPHSGWRVACHRVVRRTMPVLAEALDRLVETYGPGAPGEELGL